MDVPKSIGNWSIDEVKLVVKYPDNSTTVKNAVRNGCVWVATIQGTDIAGKVSNGYEIVASGKDEDGNEVNGYVLGCGDVFVLNRDSNATKDIEKFYVKWNDELPTNPAKGDLIYHNGYVRLCNGSEWLTLGSSDVYTKEETDNAILSALSAKEDAKYLESEDGKRRVYGNGDVYNLSSSPGTYGPWTDEYGGTRTDLQVKLVDPNVPTYIWANSTLSFFSVAFNSLEEAETATEFVEAIPNRGAHWTRTYTPGTEEWVKEDELSLKSDFDLIATTYATKDELPTKVSQLENDSGFINDGDIPTKTSQLVNDSDFATNASVDEKIGGVTSSIPTKVSQLDNDSNFATKTELNTVNQSLTTTVSEMQNELDTKATTEYVDSQIGQVLTQEEF